MDNSWRDLRLSLILPCYNEMEHIGVSLARIREFLAFSFPAGGYEIILVDDGSSDGTQGYLSALGQSDSLRVVLNPSNLGRGGAVKVGMGLARGRATGFIDIDLEVSEVYIPKFVQLIEGGADVAVAARVYKIGFGPLALTRHALSAGYGKVSHAWLGLPVTDTEAGYKFFSERAREIVRVASRFDHWFFDTECVLLADAHGLAVVEHPVLFLRNTTKTSTVRIVRDTIQYLASIREYRRWVREGLYSFPPRVP